MEKGRNPLLFKSQAGFFFIAIIRTGTDPARDPVYQHSVWAIISFNDITQRGITNQPNSVVPRRVMEPIAGFMKFIISPHFTNYPTRTASAVVR